MRAVGYQASLPIDDPQALVDIEIDAPTPKGRDLLVEVRAVSVNPIDAKIRKRGAPPPGQWAILGFDAAGVVRAAGGQASLFRPDDEVFYAGAQLRPGADAELHLVDERLVGAKPKTLGFAEAAALPLTSLTAYESLFDRLRVRDPVPGAANAVLIIGGAGGVGSIAVQLARRLTDLTVITTASRPQTRDWALALGAHHVLDHSRPLAPQVEALGLGAPGFVFSTTQTGEHLADIVELIAPFGRFAVIDDPAGGLDVMAFKRKCATIVWENMFARSTFATPDMDEQGAILNEVSRLVDAGELRTTLAERYGPVNAANLRRAHKAIESGTTRGKIVLEGFGPG